MCPQMIVYRYNLTSSFFIFINYQSPTSNFSPEEIKSGEYLYPNFEVVAPIKKTSCNSLKFKDKLYKATRVMSLALFTMNKKNAI